VLAGEKRVGQSSEGICQSGEFIFLPNKTTIDMRNIPGSREYYALLIEFDYTDFQGIQYDAHSRKNFCLGTTTPQLAMVVQQFVEWSCFAPAMLWPSRRQELVHYLYYLGYHDIPSMINHPETSHRVHAIISHNLSNDISTDSLCIQLAMSESTLRRRLKAEGTNLQNIKDQARLGHGLHLLQTTLEPIGHIAEQCGYQSQSRFTDRFKQRFGLTPTELRKTRMND
jgi:AraC-like DNA-binding protein